MEFILYTYLKNDLSKTIIGPAELHSEYWMDLTNGNQVFKYRSSTCILDSQVSLEVHNSCAN